MHSLQAVRIGFLHDMAMKTLTDGAIVFQKLLEHYGSHNAQWLSQLTHMEDPWIKARKGVPSGVGSSNVITKESMAL